MKKLILSFLIVMMLTSSLAVSADFGDKAIWQDPENIVVVCEDKAYEKYTFFRADSADGEYKYVGESKTGSFRDNSISYPGQYFYKIEKYEESEKKTFTSNPIKADIYPDKISKVSVIMYHNFVSDEDVRSGVDFDEYSIKPEEFEKDLVWLKNNGYVTITSDDLLRHLEGKKSLPRKALIISIDDGSYGVYTNAYPLLKKYNMKADFNVIGANIDSTWDKLNSGGTRVGESAPYCTWEELGEMSESGEINICSHTYGLHVYNKDKRIGMSMMENETNESFAQTVKDDYNLSLKCIEGWTGKKPETVAYPYSKRSVQSDKIIFENTGYKILMAGEDARKTSSNYFVNGCDIGEQYMVLSRPCRMDGTPISKYIERMDEKDHKNGVNTIADFLKTQNTDEIASDYQIFDDVETDAWFSGSVYYSYLNGLMKGVSEKEFAPDSPINRAMAVTLLHRLAGNDAPDLSVGFNDANGSEWWYNSAIWANENEIIKSRDGKSFEPDNPISREALAEAMYNCGKYLKMDMSKRADITIFSDCNSISEESKVAVSWAVANGIFKGSSDGSFNPTGNVTRAEMSMVLRNWLSKGE